MGRSPDTSGVGPTVLVLVVGHSFDHKTPLHLYTLSPRFWPFLVLRLAVSPTLVFCFFVFSLFRFFVFLSFFFVFRFFLFFRFFKRLYFQTVIFSQYPKLTIRPRGSARMGIHWPSAQDWVVATWGGVFYRVEGVSAEKRFSTVSGQKCCFRAQWGVNSTFGHKRSINGWIFTIF